MKQSIILSALAAFSATPLFFNDREAVAVHEDEDAVAIIPLPEGHGETGETIDITGMDALAGPAAYRTAIHAEKLLAIATAAMAPGNVLIMEFSAAPGAPVRLMGQDGKVCGWIMPTEMPAGMSDGLTQAAARINLAKPAKEKAKGDSPKPAKERTPIPEANVPAAILASEKRGFIEIDFNGKPSDEIRTAIKAEPFRFHWSGRGTRRGVPARHWYGKDTPEARNLIATLFPGIAISAAA